MRVSEVVKAVTFRLPTDGTESANAVNSWKWVAKRQNPRTTVATCLQHRQETSTWARYFSKIVKWCSIFLHWHCWLRCCLSSKRQHIMSNDDYLEDKREDYQNCSVRYCVPQLCTMIHTHMNSFWATICKTVRPMLLCYRSIVCLSVLSVCVIDVLWPNGWIYQEETWHGGRPRPWPHCVRWETKLPLKRGTALHFSAHVYCGQTAGWIKMPLGMEVHFGPGHIVLDGDPAPPKEAQPRNFQPMSVVAKQLDGSRCHLVRR